MAEGEMGAARWQFWIDRGGTFTDVVGKRPDGSLVTLKLLSDNPEQYRDAAVAGIRRLLGLAADEPVTAAQVESVKMGTTVATNALLERKGEPTLLVTTRGFRDALRIAYQDRPRLFERRIVLPELLYARVIEADERMSAGGDVVRPLDEALLEALLGVFIAGLRRGKLGKLCIDRGIVCLGSQPLELHALDVGRRHVGQCFEPHLDFGVLALGIAFVELDLGLERRAELLVAQQPLDAVLHRRVKRVGMEAFAVHLANQVRRHLAGTEALDVGLGRHFLQLHVQFLVELGGVDHHLVFALEASAQSFGNLHRSRS